MQTKGRLLSITPIRSGKKEDGTEWKTCDLVVEQDTPKKDKILLTVWGDVVDQVQRKENNEVEVEFFVKAREYKGKWYNSCVVKMLNFPTVYNDERPQDEPEGNDLPF
jgi:hypothetical protein